MKKPFINGLMIGLAACLVLMLILTFWSRPRQEGPMMEPPATAELPAVDSLPHDTLAP
ncbi:MAG: hypothetical protein AAFP92_17160 [Bacteroidota bacterium]